jgi:SAM-dependent methyltransferase
MVQRRTTWWLPTSGERWAEDYEHGRPGWPGGVAGLPGLPATATVIDLAAGTGKLTRVLLPRFRRVVAVEPQPAMVRQLARNRLGADVVAGTAEQIPLASGSVDAVFVAEAFHHLGNERSVAEIARVLRPGGALVLLWNLPAGAWEPSIEAVERLLDQRLSRMGEFEYDPLDLNHRRYSSGEWRRAFAGSRFGPFREERLANPQTLDREGLVAYFASMGWIADLPETERLDLLDAVRQRLDATTYSRTWLTHLHWTRLAASG